MGSRFIRKPRAVFGAVAVQIVDQTGRTTISVEHIGSANTDTELALLLRSAEQHLHPGQQTFDSAIWNENPRLWSKSLIEPSPSNCPTCSLTVEDPELAPQAARKPLRPQPRNYGKSSLQPMLDLGSKF
ncbi:hypothetical protein [Glutamicibacter ardleyensis]|uniref:Transposase DDE domain-containing protein n=1 Tax=Glutamicibacter ardleyensis TaxID=225894 RepID=A0ABQ2DJP8_9MICC|nr:hypothetical protein [Glutamicibacter ardleyensis]GGJ60470.1 hypothetical protein GCM10007173_19090 [Glutamicibacter ardleyensis]